MKKIVSLMLVLIMSVGVLLCFPSCADDNTIVVAMSPDFAPMEFYDTAKSGNDAIVGFDVLLANYIAKELGKTLVIKPMAFDACAAALQTNSADLAISGFSWMPERAENFLITDWYDAGNETEQTIIVKAADAGTYTSVNDFTGKTIAAQASSLQEYLVNRDLVPVGAQLVSFQDTNDALQALIGGQVDAFAVAEGNGEAFISQHEDDVDFSGFFFDIDDQLKNNVILINKNNNDLCTKVNAALAKAKAAGLYETWINASKAYANVSTVNQDGYDKDGNMLFDPAALSSPVTDADQLQKVAYEQCLAAIKG